jgi:tetratricopeptide (TPR) repeat protein
VSQPSRSTRPLSAPVLQWFVDRHEALEQFAVALRREQAALLTIEGPTGIGKTWFLVHCRQEAERQGRLAANLDLRWARWVDDLWMADHLCHGLGWEQFPVLMETIERGVKLDVLVKFEGGGGDVRIEDSEINAPVAGGSVFENVTFKLNTSDKQLRESWLNQVNDAFFDDLAQLGTRQGAVLLFDEVEHVCPPDPTPPAVPAAAPEATEAIRPPGALLWLENQLLWRLGDGLLPGVQVVLAGQRLPPLPSAWDGVTVALQVGELPAEEVRKYLQMRKGRVITEETVAAVCRWTKRRPDLVAALADRVNLDLPPGEETDPSRLLEILVQAILDERAVLEAQDQQEPRLRDALRAAAIPEWFDAGLLSALAIAESDERLADLRDFSFVQPVPEDGRALGNLWALREEARGVLLASWANAPSRLAELQRCAAAYFVDRAQEAAADSAEQQAMTVEAVGNLLAVDEVAGCEQIRQLCAGWEEAYQVTAYGQLLARARRVPGLRTSTMAWLAYLEGRLALLRDQAAEAAEQFRAAQAAAEPSSELYVLAGQGMGEALAVQGDWPAAVKQYTRALEYYTGRGDLAGQGLVQLLLGSAYLDSARSLGPPIEPRLENVGGLLDWLRGTPRILVSLPFVLYARLIRRWRFLPPLQQTMDYRNWTLMRLLLSSVSCTSKAESAFETGGLLEKLPLASRRLGQAYHLLGWWHDAAARFQRARSSPLAAANPYWRAQVLVEQADAQHAAGDLEHARDNLEESAAVFDRYRDAASAAEARTLLGQVYLEAGESAPGLELLAANLPRLAKDGNRLAAGIALHRLRSWLARGTGTAAEQAAVRQLVADIQDQVFLARVPDRAAAALEAAVAAVLGLALAIGVLALAASFGANLTSSGSFIAGLVSPASILRTVAWLALLAWCLLVGVALAGLLLVTWSARRQAVTGAPREFGSVAAEGVAIGPAGLALVDRHGRPMPDRRLAWAAVEAFVTVERVLWRTPLALISGLRLFGQGLELPVPATVLWYDTLKAEIERGLSTPDPRFARRRLDLHVMRSRSGLAFVLGVLLLLVGSALVYRWQPLPVSVELAAALGPPLMYLAVVALVVGPYWWLVLHPLWVRYHLQPRSAAPFVAAPAGAVLVALAFYLSLRVPYFAVRPTLDRFFFPLGFVLILAMPLWIVLARRWTRPLAARGGPAYPPAWRVAAVVVFAGALALTGTYTEREWYYDVTHNYQAITRFYYEDYSTTVVLFSQQIDDERNLATAHYYRGRAYLALGRPAEALGDFQQIISSGQAAAAHYWLSAEARLALDDRPGACADLTIALTTRQWPLSAQEKARAAEEFEKPCADIR